MTDQLLSHREQADVQPRTCRVQVCTASRVSESASEEPVGKMESSRFSVSRGIKTGVSIFLPTPPLPLALNTSPHVSHSECQHFRPPVFMDSSGRV